MNAREIARLLGRRGGLVRARRLSADDRRRIASLGGQARRRSFEGARRIADNFRYAASIDELQARPQKVTRLKTFAGPLPGVYAAKS